MTQNITRSNPNKAGFRLIAGLALGLGFAGAAQADPIVLRVHHFLPAVASAQVKLIQPWCDKVAKESNEQLKCQIYPSMQLGGTPPQLIDQVRDGVVDVIWTVPTYAPGRFTKSEVFELPWMTTSAKAGSQALWTYVDKHSADEFKGIKRIFMHVHDGALLHFSKAQPKTIEDFKGLKIRAATRANTKMIQALGATAIGMPLPSVPEAMSKGVVDGAAVPWEGSPSIRLPDFASYHLDSPDGSPRMSNTIFLFGMNQAKYDSLPADLKKVIDNNSGLATSAWAGEVGFDAVRTKYREDARKAGGVIYTLPEAELQRWVKASDAVDEGWVADANAKGADGKKLLSEARALVQQYTK